MLMKCWLSCKKHIIFSFQLFSSRDVEKIASQLIPEPIKFDAQKRIYIFVKLESLL